MTLSSVFSLTDPLPEGRIAIEASAGTGKTFTLAGLVVRYVAERAVPTSELLVVTFTRAATAELRDRVRSRLSETAAALRYPPDVPSGDELVDLLVAHDRVARLERVERAVVDFDAATITTIHGFAQQVLATLGSAAPGDPDASFSEDTTELVASVCADLIAAASLTQADHDAPLPTLDALAEIVRIVLTNPGIDIVPAGADATSVPGAASLRDLVTRAVEQVHRRRRAAGTIAFDDLLTRLRDALAANPAAIDALRRRFRVALIDEFQDTDPLQWALFSQLFGAPGTGTSLVLVGDPKQAIYSFRGADVRTYLEAAYAPGTRRSTLVVNWRSDGALLSALDRLLTGVTFGDERIAFVPVAAAPQNVGRRLTSHDGAALPPLRFRIPPGRPAVGETELVVADDLGDEIRRLLETAWLPPQDDGAPRRPVRPKDIAVLISAHTQSQPILHALRRRGIPAVVTRGDSVLEAEATTHWRWLLNALTRPADPTRARTAALSWFFGWSLEQVATADDGELGAVQEDLARWAELLTHEGTGEFCVRVFAESGVAPRVLSMPAGDRNLTDLDHISSLLQVAVTARHPTAAGLLAALAELGARHPADPDRDITARRVESASEAVQIMTAHVAKGLEFPVVCIPSLWRTGRSQREVVFHDPVTGRRTIDVAKSSSWPSKAEAAERKSLAQRDTAGENLRLLYVAFTRAKHQSIVWWSLGQHNGRTGLAKVLFARDDGAIDPERFAATSVALPPNAEATALIASSLGPDDGTIEVAMAIPSTRVVRWDDRSAPAPVERLELAELGRVPDRRYRRWSFSTISDHSPWLGGDDSLGDARGDDEALPGEISEPAGAHLRDEPAGEDLVSDLPLGAVPGGAQFGTLVHDVLERVDFSSGDLLAELDAQVREQLRFYPGTVDRPTLVDGLQAAIDSPLGPLFQGRSLRDLLPGDSLRELQFDLRLGTGPGNATATDRDIGNLVLAHLSGRDPLVPWASQLAGGIFGVELAGHLTGSIDAVFRVAGEDAAAGARFVVVDYKTNTLGEIGRPTRSLDYRQGPLADAMAEHHYPLQALLYAVALHRFLRWRLAGYDASVHLGGAAYLFIRGMAGAATPVVAGHPDGVFSWAIPPPLVIELSELLDRGVPR